MTAAAVEGLVILVLIVANGLLAMSEIATVSARTARLKSMVASGDRRAEEALRFARDPDRLLATVQIGITLVAVLSGAYAGVTIARRIEQFFTTLPGLQAHAEGLSVGIVVAAITYLTLVLGELAPKRLALSAPERVAVLVAWPMRWLSTLTAPAVWLLTRSTAALLFPFRATGRREEPATADEIEVLVEEGADVGVFAPVERELVGRALRLREYRARDLMVPRTMLESFKPGDRPADLLEVVSPGGQSHYLVLHPDGETVLGVARGWDVLVAAAGRERLSIGELAQEPVFVPESTSLLDVLDTLRQVGSDAAAIIDEHGGLAGLISREEVLRAIGGRMASATSPVAAPDWEQLEDGSIMVDGLLPLVELRQGLGARHPLPEESRFSTVGGFTMSRLQRIPEVGDAFVAHGCRFEVVEVEGRRVSRVRATPADQSAEVPRDEAT